MRGEDFGKLILRLTVGGLLLLHGIFKIRNGIDMLGGMLEAKGLPAALRFGVYAGEVLGPVLLILGFLTRPAAILVFINMATAIYLAHMGDLESLNKGGGWAVELPVMFGLGALAIVFLGAGKMSLRKGIPRVD